MNRKKEWLRIIIVLGLFFIIPILGLKLVQKDEIIEYNDESEHEDEPEYKNETMVERIILQDDFEDYIPEADLTAVTAWSNSSLHAADSLLVKLTSSNRALLDINGGGSGQYAQFDFVWDTGVVPGSVAPQFVVNFKTMPNTDKLNLEIFSGVTRGIQVFFNSDGSVQARDDATFRTLTGLTIVATNDYKFEFIITDNTYHIRVNGVKYDNAGSDYLNDNDWTGAVNVIRWKEWASNTFEVYIDDILFKQTSKGMQWFTWTLETNKTLTLDSASDLIETTSNSLLFRASGDIYKTTPADLSTWTIVTGLTSPSAFVAIEISSVLYCHYKMNGNDSVLSKSIDDGDNWADIASITGYTVLDLFEISGTLFASAMKSDLSDIAIFKYNLGGDSWASQDTEPTTLASVARFKGYVEGNIYYYFVRDQAGASFMKYDDSITTITQIMNTIFYVITAEQYALLKDGSTFYTTWFKVADSKRYLVKSTDTGVTWSEVIQGAYKIIPQVFHDVENKIWTIDENTEQILYYDFNIGHFLKAWELTFTIGTQRSLISTSGYIINFDGASTTNLYAYVNNASIIKSCTIKGFGNERTREAEWLIDPFNKAIFSDGDIVEFLDGFDELAFKGVVIDNKFKRGVGQVITALPLKAELLDDPRSNVRSFTASATDTIVKSILGEMSFIFEDGDIDSNGDFTITYIIDIKTPIKDYIKLARELERAVFYVEPSGKAHMMAHDQLDSTGLRWKNNSINQIQLSDEFIKDLRLTRSEVIGAYVRGSADNIEVRKDYIGNAPRETTGGIVRISVSRPQLTNHTEVVQLAQNRFNIYGVATRFVELVNVKNQGFIQPGKTISFSWSEDDVVIPKGDFFVAKWKYNLKFDVYTEFWLSDNIITPEEFAKVKQTIGRDNQLTNTYHEGENETTGDGVVPYQNPVAKLRAGTSIWRIPEPSSADFAIGDLTDDTAWNDLNLSSLIPAGDRVVRLSVKYQTPFVGDNILFRQKGQSNDIQVDGLYSQIANKPDIRGIEVGVDANGKCQIKVDRSPTNWSQIDITVIKREL